MDVVALDLIQLGAVFVGLGMLAGLAGRIGLPPVPFYVVGGLCFGKGGFIRFEGLDEFGTIASEIGVILLLLMLGLEYTATELVSGLRQSWAGGLLDAALNAAPGILLAWFLGWGGAGMLIMAGVTWISSSGIAAKTLTDLGRLGNRETPSVLSVLVLEDLAMAIYLPILTTVLAGAGILGGMEAVVVAMLVIAAVLVVALRYGRAVSTMVNNPDNEVFLLRIFGAALLVAGIAAILHVSAAVGAFLLGIAISGLAADNAKRMLEPLRDLFAALFFVVFGLNTDPRLIPPVLGWALLLVLATTLTKMLTGWWTAKRAGIRVPGRLRAGATLVARGEFSIVIAGLAVASGAAPPGLAALAAAYVMLMAVLGPIFTRYVEPLTRLALPNSGTMPV